MIRNEYQLQEAKFNSEQKLLRLSWLNILRSCYLPGAVCALDMKSHDTGNNHIWKTILPHFVHIYFSLE